MIHASKKPVFQAKMADTTWLKSMFYTNINFQAGFKEVCKVKMTQLPNLNKGKGRQGLEALFPYETIRKKLLGGNFTGIIS